MAFSQRALLLYPAAGLSAAMQDAVAQAYVTHLGLESFADERAMFATAAAVSSDYGATGTHRQISSAMTPALAAAIKTALAGMMGNWYLLDAASGVLLDTNDTTKKPGATVTKGLEWRPGTAYTAGEVVQHEGIMYQVIAPGHTSQAGWTPDVAVALFKRYTPPGETGEWRQPLAAFDAYPVGARVTHGGKTWVNELAANVWQPGVQGWKEVTTGGGIGEWKQPTGAHDSYKKGDHVTWKGSTWESTLDANVWEPGVYGWQKV